jgi:hypothetical protein
MNVKMESWFSVKQPDSNLKFVSLGRQEKNAKFYIYVDASVVRKSTFADMCTYVLLYA